MESPQSAETHQYYTVNDFSQVIFTGPRDWQDEDTVRILLHGIVNSHFYPVIIHGGCPTGVDHIVDNYARRLHCDVKKEDAEWAKYGNRAGPIRNEKMAQMGATLCVAFRYIGRPWTAGTGDMVRQAKKHHIKIIEVHA